MGVFHDKDFEDELNALGVDPKRLDGAMRYVEQQLSEDPTGGIESAVPGIYVAPVRLPAGNGQLILVSVFYTYDGKDVTFRMLRRAT